MNGWRTKDVLTVDQAAGILEVDRRVVYDSIRSGELHAVKIGARILRIPVSSLRRFLGEQQPDSPIEPPSEGNVAALRAADEGA